MLARTSDAPNSYRPATVVGMGPALEETRSYRLRFLESPKSICSVTESKLLREAEMCKVHQREIRRLPYKKGSNVMGRFRGREFKSAQVVNILPPSLCDKPYVIIFPFNKTLALRGPREIRLGISFAPKWNEPTLIDTMENASMSELLEESVVTTETKVVEAGERATLRNGMFKLIVPQGATRTKQQIGVTSIELPCEEKTHIPSDLKAIMPGVVDVQNTFMASNIVDFSPSGATFNKPVKISIRPKMPHGPVRPDQVAIYCIGEQVKKKPMNFHIGDPVSVYSYSQRSWKHDGIANNIGTCGEVNVVYGGSNQFTKIVQRKHLLNDLRHRGHWRYKWERCKNNHFDPKSGVVTATTSHFSLFCVVFSDLEAGWTSLPIKYDAPPKPQPNAPLPIIQNWEKVHHGINFEVVCSNVDCPSNPGKKTIFIPLKSSSDEKESELVLGQELDIRTIIVERTCPACKQPIDPSDFQTLIVFNSVFKWRGETLKHEAMSGELDFLGTSHAHRSSLVEKRDWKSLYITPIQVGNRKMCVFKPGLQVEARHDGEINWKTGEVLSAENGYYEIKFPDGIGRNYINVRTPGGATGGSEVARSNVSMRTSIPSRIPVSSTLSPLSQSVCKSGVSGEEMSVERADQVERLELEHFTHDSGDMHAGRMVKSPVVKASETERPLHQPEEKLREVMREDNEGQSETTSRDPMQTSRGGYAGVIKDQAEALRSYAPNTPPKEPKPNKKGSAGCTPCPSSRNSARSSPITAVTPGYISPTTTGATMHKQTSVNTSIYHSPGPSSPEKPPEDDQDSRQSRLCESMTSSPSSPEPLRRPSTRIPTSGDEGSMKQESTSRGGGFWNHKTQAYTLESATDRESYYSPEPDGGSVVAETPRGGRADNVQNVRTRPQRLPRRAAKMRLRADQASPASSTGMPENPDRWKGFREAKKRSKRKSISPRMPPSPFKATRSPLSNTRLPYVNNSRDYPECKMPHVPTSNSDWSSNSATATPKSITVHRHRSGSKSFTSVSDPDSSDYARIEEKLNVTEMELRTILKKHETPGKTADYSDADINSENARWRSSSFCAAQAAPVNSSPTFNQRRGRSKSCVADIAPASTKSVKSLGQGPATADSMSNYTHEVGSVISNISGNSSGAAPQPKTPVSPRGRITTPAYDCNSPNEEAASEVSTPSPMSSPDLRKLGLMTSWDEAREFLNTKEVLRLL